MVLPGAPDPAHMQSTAAAALSPPVLSATLPPPVAAAAAPAPSDGQRLAPSVVSTTSSSARTTTLAVNMPMIKVNASVLKSIHGFGELDDDLFKDKVLRKMAPGQLDIYDDDVSDKIAMADVVAALLGVSMFSARQWLSNTKNMNKEIAPSLTYVKSPHVRFLNPIKSN